MALYASTMIPNYVKGLKEFEHSQHYTTNVLSR